MKESDKMEIINVTKDIFQNEVLKSSLPVLVDFNANWCGPCRMLRPILEEVSKERENIKIVSVNVDDEEELAREYGVMSIPCLVLIKNGQEVTRNVGLIGKDEINRLIGE